MASYSYPTLGFNLLHELGNNDIVKVNPGGRKHEIITEKPFNLKTKHLELKPRKHFCSLSMSKFDSTMMKPRFMDVVVHKTRPEELKERRFDLSLLSELMSLETLRSSSQLPYAPSSVLYLNQESAKTVLDLMVDGSNLFSSSKAELNDMFTFESEFHMLRNSTRWRKLSRVVPQFSISRFDSEVLIDTPEQPEVKLDEVAAKTSPKKRNPNTRDREKDLYKRNHLQACESLISLMIGNEQHRQITISSLKKSGGDDLTELLSQFSIGIAGIGIAVFFSLVCDIASKRVPFCADKVFETALSFGLGLLSWAVSRLKEAIVDVNRKAIKDREMMNRVERRIKDVYLRAVTVIAIVALRLR